MKKNYNTNLIKNMIGQNNKKYIIKFIFFLCNILLYYFDQN